MQETQVRYFGQEDSLEKEMATHSNVFAWESDGERNLVGYSPWGWKTAGHDSATKQKQKGSYRKIRTITYCKLLSELYT